MDDNGVLTTNTWDEENRIVTLATPSLAESYQYSGNGQRRKKSTSSDEVRYVWDRQNVLQELDAANSLIAHYTDSPGRWGGLSSVRLSSGGSTALAGMGAFNAAQFNTVMFNQSGSVPASRFYLFDQQASTRLLTDALAAVTDGYAYRGFGEEVFTSGTSRNPLRFQGMVGIRRETNGLDWMRARIYDPVTGQFVSNDPIGFMGGDWNLYRFVGNNPLKQVDPSGKITPLIWVLIIVAGIGLVWVLRRGCGQTPTTPPPPRIPNIGTGDCSAYARMGSRCVDMCEEIQEQGSAERGTISDCCRDIYNGGNPGNLPGPGLPQPVPPGPSFDAIPEGCMQVFCNDHPDLCSGV